jgi:hypothetical protein
MRLSFTELRCTRTVNNVNWETGENASFGNDGEEEASSSMYQAISNVVRVRELLQQN